MTPSPSWQAPRSPAWTPTAWLILRDPDQATDAVQNTLVRAWRDLPTLRDPGSVRRLAPPAAGATPASMRSRRAPAPSRRRRPHRRLDPAVRRRRRVGDRRPRPARTRLQPPRAGGAGGHRPASLPRPAAAGGRQRRCGIPLGTAKSRLHRGPRDDARGARRRRSARARASGGPSGMTDRRRLRPRPSPTWLHADAEHRVPDHLDAVLRADAHGAPAAGMVEPRKVAPRANNTSLHAGAQGRLAAGRPRPDRRASALPSSGSGRARACRRRSGRPATGRSCTQRRRRHLRGRSGDGRERRR